MKYERAAVGIPETLGWLDRLERAKAARRDHALGGTVAGPVPAEDSNRR